MKITNFKYILEPMGKMKVPVVIYTTENLADFLFKDKAVEQLKNVATLPGIVKYAIGMPDLHEGYGFPIGGVAAFDSEDGVISPGGVGFDINCGVRVIKTNLAIKEFIKYANKVGELIYKSVPSGLGSQGVLRFTKKEVKSILNEGLRWAVNKGFAFKEDIENTEDGGAMVTAESSFVSDKALKRGKTELGTLGAGNHFLEIGVIDKIYNQSVAQSFGLFENQIVVWVHTGSRGLGHQIATDYINLMRNRMARYKIPLLDRDLVSLPLSDPLSGDYLRAMAAAANFAWVNRQIITFHIRNAFAEFFKQTPEQIGMYLLYDVAHNIAKFERYIINGKEKLLLVHRKGATRAFPPGHPALKGIFKKTGQPVLLPGDMKSGSFIFVGRKNSLKESFGSISHGAGRLLSRHKALKQITFEEVLNEMNKAGITLLAGNRRIVREEAPEAYKDINEIIKPIEYNGLAERVAHSKPILVIKG